MSDKVSDKKGNIINEGNEVWTKIRGGKREGKVEEIITSKEKAAEKDVKNPPKVLFHDQHGHRVAHDPGTLEDLDKK